SGPISGHVLVFPRTSTTIRYEHGPTATAGPPAVLFYNAGQHYTRRRIDGIDASDWFLIAPDAAREAVSRHDPGAAAREGRIFPYAIAPAAGRLYLAQRRLH